MEALVSFLNGGQTSVYPTVGAFWTTTQARRSYVSDAMESRYSVRETFPLYL